MEALVPALASPEAMTAPLNRGGPASRFMRMMATCSLHSQASHNAQPRTRLLPCRTSAWHGRHHC